MAAHGIEPIDMVVVNLYAFEKTASQPGVAFGHLIENIDIGGPSMVRSAAKNFEDVAIVTRVPDYPALIGELKANNGALSRETRWRLARQAFALPLLTTAQSPIRSTRSPMLPHPTRPAAASDAPRLPQRCASTFRWPNPFVTAKTPTSAPRSMPMEPAWALPGLASSRARNSASTIWWIWTPAGSWRRSLTSR